MHDNGLYLELNMENGTYSCKDYGFNLCLLCLVEIKDSIQALVYEDM